MWAEMNVYFGLVPVCAIYIVCRLTEYNDHELLKPRLYLLAISVGAGIVAVIWLPGLVYVVPILFVIDFVTKNKNNIVVKATLPVFIVYLIFASAYPEWKLMKTNNKEFNKVHEVKSDENTDDNKPTQDNRQYDFISSYKNNSPDQDEFLTNIFSERMTALIDHGVKYRVYEGADLYLVDKVKYTHVKGGVSSLEFNITNGGKYKTMRDILTHVYRHGFLQDLKHRTIDLTFIDETGKSTKYRITITNEKLIIHDEQ